MTAVLGPVGSAAAARRAPVRPPVLGAPLHVGAVAPALPHPVRNREPRPNFIGACADGWRSSECTRLALRAIKNARAAEGLKHPKLVLPRNYKSLTVAQQTFVITNLERVGRGLRPFTGLTRRLNLLAQTAALARLDPEIALSLMRSLQIFTYGSNWAGDFGPLASDYDWMYNDGYGSGGINIACLTPRSAGCWGHRDNILGTYQRLPNLLAGAGSGLPAGLSIAMLMTGARGTAPSFTYTWREAKRHGAGGGGS